MASVEYRYVSKSFDPDRHALAGLSVEVADGEFLAVLGRSGSGKTTMLRLLTGLDDPDAEGLTGLGGDHLPTRAGARRWRTSIKCCLPMMSATPELATKLDGVLARAGL